MPGNEMGLKMTRVLGAGLLMFCLSSACATTTVDSAETVEKTETVATSESVQPVTEEVAAKQTAAANQAAIKERYDVIEYGQALSMVCTNPVAAEGNLADRPNLQVMWENYLYDRPEGIWGEIGGLVEVNGNLPLDQGRWTNACAVRVSHMLNQAGHKIPRNGGTTVSGGNKDQYIYRLKDMEAYLTKAFGEPDLAILDGSADSFDIPPKPGILVMDFPGSTFSGHTTIWNGAGSVDNADIGGHRVLFWELPCFVPEERDQTPIVKSGVSHSDLTP